MLEKFFDKLSYKDVYFALTSILNNDCYVQDFFEDEALELFLELVEAYDIVYIASDDRVLLTPRGEKFLQNIAQRVDFEKSSTKIKKNEYNKN